MSRSEDSRLGERRRALDENARRRREITADRYAPWNRAERLMVDGRARVAAEMLFRHDVFPSEDSRCLEIGFGNGGWLPTLLAWGARESLLFGVEIDPARAAAAHRRLPSARLSIADGGALPFADSAFDLVIASTVLTSVLDPMVRRSIAEEVERVLSPRGALLWYDFAFDNPRNKNVKAIGRRELADLFPKLTGEVRSVTLAPPILRPLSRLGAAPVELLSCLPFLRSHLLAVLKPA